MSVGESRKRIQEIIRPMPIVSESENFPEPQIFSLKPFPKVREELSGPKSPSTLAVIVPVSMVARLGVADSNAAAAAQQCRSSRKVLFSVQQNGTPALAEVANTRIFNPRLVAPYGSARSRELSIEGLRLSDIYCLHQGGCTPYLTIKKMLKRGQTQPFIKQGMIVSR